MIIHRLINMAHQGYIEINMPLNQHGASRIPKNKHAAQSSKKLKNMYSIFKISIGFVLLVVNQVQSSSGAYKSNDVHQGGDKPNPSSVTLPGRPSNRQRNRPKPNSPKRAHKPENTPISNKRKPGTDEPKPEKPHKGKPDTDAPKEETPPTSSKGKPENGSRKPKNTPTSSKRKPAEESKYPSIPNKGDEKPTKESNPPENSNSSGKVVLQFGWSDTDTSKVDSALKDAGIVNYERSGSSDKGLGIVVVTKEQAEAFKKYAGGSAKVFANIQEAKGGLSSTDELKVSFKEGSDNGDIGFGDCDYGGIVTDDPSNVVSGTAKGEQKGDDALWSTENGQSAKVKMSGGGGRQYVIMKADMTA